MRGDAPLARLAAEGVDSVGPGPAPSAVAGKPRASTLIASVHHAAVLGFFRRREPPGTTCIVAESSFVDVAARDATGHRSIDRAEPCEATATRDATSASAGGPSLVVSRGGQPGCSSRDTSNADRHAARPRENRPRTIVASTRASASNSATTDAAPEPAAPPLAAAAPPRGGRVRTGGTDGTCGIGGGVAAYVRATGAGFGGRSDRGGSAAVLADPRSRSASPASTSGDAIADPSFPVASPGAGLLGAGEGRASVAVTSRPPPFSAGSHRATEVCSWISRRPRLPGDTGADGALIDGVATGSVAAEPVATGLVALGGVATGCVAGGPVMGPSVAAALVAGGGVAPAGVAVVADGAVPLVGAPAESRAPMRGAASTSMRAARLAGPGGAAFAGGAVATCPSRCPEVAEPLSGGPLAGLNDRSGVAGMTTLCSAREVSLVSTVVRVASTRFRGPAPDAEFVPAGTTDAEAPFDPGLEASVPADAAFAETP